MATIQNAFQFLGFNVINIVFERPIGLVSGEFSINLEHIAQISSADSSLFQVIFIVTVADKDNAFNLQVKAVSDFKVVGDVQNDIFENFMKINAPAIAYPYLRAFISNLALQAGMVPIIIPYVNFTQVNLNKTAYELKNPEVIE